MEEKVRVRRPHRLNMEDRKRIDFTGITDVVSCPVFGSAGS